VPSLNLELFKTLWIGLDSPLRVTSPQAVALPRNKSRLRAALTRPGQAILRWSRSETIQRFDVDVVTTNCPDHDGIETPHLLRQT
jgi:hypothetical protein